MALRSHIRDRIAANDPSSGWFAHRRRPPDPLRQAGCAGVRCADTRDPPPNGLLAHAGADRAAARRPAGVERAGWISRYSGMGQSADVDGADPQPLRVGAGRAVAIGALAPVHRTHRPPTGYLLHAPATRAP